MLKRDRLDAIASVSMLGLAALWGLSHVAVKVANAGISPAFQSGLRSAGALAVLLAWAAWRRADLFARDGTLIPGIVAGVLFAAEFALIYWALVFTDVARGIIFVYTAPFFVALGAHLFVPGEHIGRVQAAGLAAAFAGIMIAFWDGLTLPSPRALIGDTMMVMAAALWAATTIVIKATTLARIDPVKTLAYQLAVSGAALLVLAPLMGEPGIFDPTPLVVASLLFQIVIVASFSYLAWFAMIRVYPASTMHAFTFLTPLFSLIFGGWLLGERVSAALVVSLGLVAAGIWLVNRPRPA
jgi:drug/metabolite transporter (DMT)-like permease